MREWTFFRLCIGNGGLQSSATGAAGMIAGLRLFSPKSPTSVDTALKRDLAASELFLDSLPLFHPVRSRSNCPSDGILKAGMENGGPVASFGMACQQRKRPGPRN